LTYDRKPPPVEGKECKENTFDGVFENKEDIQRLTEKLITAKTDIYQEKYF